LFPVTIDIPERQGGQVRLRRFLLAVRDDAAFSKRMDFERDTQAARFSTADFLCFLKAGPFHCWNAVARSQQENF
jgi:hypothetical protein